MISRAPYPHTPATCMMRKTWECTVTSSRAKAKPCRRRRPRGRAGVACLRPTAEATHLAPMAAIAGLMPPAEAAATPLMPTVEGERHAVAAEAMRPSRLWWRPQGLAIVGAGRTPRGHRQRSCASREELTRLVTTVEVARLAAMEEATHLASDLHRSSWSLRASQ